MPEGVKWRPPRQGETQNRGGGHPALWTKHSLLTTAALQCFNLGLRRIWRDWHERISTLRGLGNPRGAFRRLLCLQHVENSHESKSSRTQHWGAKAGEEGNRITNTAAGPVVFGFMGTHVRHSQRYVRRKSQGLGLPLVGLDGFYLWPISVTSL